MIWPILLGILLIAAMAMRSCLRLEVVPAFAPPQETGLQAMIENNKGRCQATDTLIYLATLSMWNGSGLLPWFGRRSISARRGNRLLCSSGQRCASPASP